MTKKTVLYVGCGTDHVLGKHGFDPEHWQELRLDIDPGVKPDIVGNMMDMSEIKDNSVEAVYSSHNIEHLYPHEVPIALGEFLRVLTPDGMLLLSCPDIQPVCAAVAANKLSEPLYYTASGLPITPIDVLYGCRLFMLNGNSFMAHHCGFTAKVLLSSINSAKFGSAVVVADNKSYALYAVATKQKMPDETLKQLFAQYWLSSPRPAKH